MVQQIVRKRPRMPRTHSKAGSNPQGAKISVENFKVNRRVSTDRLYRWRWSPCRLLVDPGWLHLTSSQWTSSSTLRAEGRNIPNSTEIHWCYKVYSCWSGCATREEDWRLLECRFKQTFVSFLEKGSQNSLCWKKNLQEEKCGPVRDWRRSKRLPDQIMYGQKFGRRIGEGAQNREKQEWAKEKLKLDNARRLRGIYFHCSRRQRILRNSQKGKKKIGKTCGSRDAV